MSIVIKDVQSWDWNFSNIVAGMTTPVDNQLDTTPRVFHYNEEIIIAGTDPNLFATVSSASITQHGTANTYDIGPLNPGQAGGSGPWSVLVPRLPTFAQFGFHGLMDLQLHDTANNVDSNVFQFYLEPEVLTFTDTNGLRGLPGDVITLGGAGLTAVTSAKLYAGDSQITTNVYPLVRVLTFHVVDDNHIQITIPAITNQELYDNETSQGVSVANSGKYEIVLYYPQDGVVGHSVFGFSSSLATGILKVGFPAFKMTQWYYSSGDLMPHGPTNITVTPDQLQIGDVTQKHGHTVEVVCLDDPLYPVGIAMIGFRDHDIHETYYLHIPLTQNIDVVRVYP